MSTRAELLLGANYEGDEAFCTSVVNAIKNHFRVSDPCVNMTERQPGEILSDPDDDKLYHVGGESGHPCDEILQATRSCDVIPEFAGVDLYDACLSAYFQRIISSTAEGLAGADLRIGLDQSLRTAIICDYGDIGNDFGLAAATHPRLVIFSNAGSISQRLDIDHNRIISQSSISIQHDESYFNYLMNDLAAGHAFWFIGDAGAELTDTNAEQAWVYIHAQIRQTLTAGYIGLLVDITQITVGDASSGAGYNALMILRRGGGTQFAISSIGRVCTNQTAAYTTLGNVTDRWPIYDVAGTFVGYVALYDTIT